MMKSITPLNEIEIIEMYLERFEIIRLNLDKFASRLTLYSVSC